jgi:RNA polymerase sigma-70 factor (ECF subfamily)
MGNSTVDGTNSRAECPYPTVKSMQRDLVVRASGGDHAAYSELANAAIGGLYRVAYLILRQPEPANDAVQNALISAWRDIRGLRDPDRFDAWLHRLTVRACYRLARTERRRSVAEGVLEEVDSPPTIDDDLRLLAIRDQLERAFARLTPEERSVLVLRYHLDLPLNEAAQALAEINVKIAELQQQRVSLAQPLKDRYTEMAKELSDMASQIRELDPSWKAGSLKPKADAKIVEILTANEKPMTADEIVKAVGNVFTPWKVKSTLKRKSSGAKAVFAVSDGCPRN